MVGPMTDSYVADGPFISPITGNEYYRWRYVGSRKGHRDHIEWDDYEPSQPEDSVHRRVGRVRFGMADDIGMAAN
jgi:hypothetical protein